MDKYAIIKLKLKGHSNRGVARMTGVNRKTVARYWDVYWSSIFVTLSADISNYIL